MAPQRDRDLNGRAWDTLEAAVSRLAQPPTAQADYLRALGTPDLPDELALEFDDVWLPLESRTGEAPPQVTHTLLELSDKLSDGVQDWGGNALETPEWTAVREAAAAAEAALHEWRTG